MPAYSGEGSRGPTYSGFAMIGPPFKCEKTFEKMEAEWGKGRVTATFTGTIIESLPYPISLRDGTESHVPEKAVGEEVRMYLPHQIKNHELGETEDSYQWLNTFWTKKGRPFAAFWTSWVMARAGFSCEDLSHNDYDQLCLEIQAALNAGGAWAAPIQDSALRAFGFQRPIPPGEECIAVYHGMPYFDWRLRRPTWVMYDTVTQEGKPRKVREVVFLLRVVAPEKWRGVLLPLKANYTLIHGIKDGVEMWDKTHQNATIDSVLGDLGISPLSEFFENIPEERLYEHELGEIVNVLDYVDTALRRAVKMGHQLYVEVPAEGWINREAVKPATTLNIQRIAGDGFVVPTLKTVKELGPITPQDEPIPGFGDEVEKAGNLSTAEVIAFLNEVAAVGVANPDGTFVIPEGVEWMRRFILPISHILGLDRNAPFDGWTEATRETVNLALSDESYTKGCADRNLDDEEALAAIVEYAQNLLVGEDLDVAEPATAF